MLLTAHKTFLHVNLLYTKSTLNDTILSFTIFASSVYTNSCRISQIDAEEILHEFMYTDEAGFKQPNQEEEGDIIGHRAIINVMWRLHHLSSVFKIMLKLYEVFVVFN